MQKKSGLSFTQHALLEKISAYFQALSVHNHKPIYAKLDRRLFSPDNETIADCLAQAQTTLQTLRQLRDDQQAEFYAEKLVAQYHALLELSTANRASQRPAPAPKPSAAPKHSVHALPPAERLEKYYEFLTRLNDLIAEQAEQLLTCPTNDKPLLLQKIAASEQRKQRCQDAIDHLEEYLAFVAEREKKESAVWNDLGV
ncbi:primosomal replication protein PriC [Pasteurella testudinis]|uniref:primosomal replication protein PriC n=1 Tax=Pasteurella testudinis TaxID=761 RepID=UPI0040588127